MSDKNPYLITVKGTTFDFYDLSDAIKFEQAAVEHAVKKLVALGKRSGNKSYLQDLHEATMSLFRAQEQYRDALLRDPTCYGMGSNPKMPEEQQELPLSDQFSINLTPLLPS